MHNKKILIVDDDFHIRKIVENAFIKMGAQVFTAPNGNEGLRVFFEQRPDLVILDIMMPEMDGFETSQRIRQLADTPIILLTAMNENEQIVHGLDCGADDFVTKPFSTDVLTARGRAVLRRSTSKKSSDPVNSYKDDHLFINLESHQVLVDGEQVKLTPTEFRLLTHLIKNVGRVCSIQNILDNVWGIQYRDSPDYVHVYVSHIRGKIEKDSKNPEYIHTEYGVGYRFK